MTTLENRQKIPRIPSPPLVDRRGPKSANPGPAPVTGHACCGGAREKGHRPAGRGGHGQNATNPAGCLVIRPRSANIWTGRRPSALKKGGRSILLRGTREIGTVPAGFDSSGGCGLVSAGSRVVQEQKLAEPRPLIYTARAERSRGVSINPDVENRPKGNRREP